MHDPSAACTSIDTTLANLLAAATAWIGVSLLRELIERGLIGGKAGSLIDHLAVPLQRTSLQASQDCAFRPGHRAGYVNVLDTHQPLAAGGASVEKAGQRRHQRSLMEGAGGRRGEASAIARQVCSVTCWRRQPCVRAGWPNAWPRGYRPLSFPKKRPAPGGQTGGRLAHRRAQGKQTYLMRPLRPINTKPTPASASEAGSGTEANVLASAVRNSMRIPPTAP